VPRWHRWAGPGDHRGRNVYVVLVYCGAAARSKAAQRENQECRVRLAAALGARATNGAVYII